METFLTVTQVNSYLNEIITNDEFLKLPISIHGELTNVKISNEIIYATLKDDESQISIIIFNYKSFEYKPQNGDKVKIVGKVSLYKAQARISLIVHKIQREGIGDLHEKFELLKKELEKEGLFDKKYKKPCPLIPLNVCIVTSETGAVRHDIEKTIKHNNAYINLSVVNTSVQGTKSEEEVIKALNKADKMNFDVIILARGGGAFEDLNTFNSELVARTIFKLKTFIVSAIGHETDFTISDFVADYRAATPTGAAEYIADVLNNYIANVLEMLLNIRHSVTNILNVQKTDAAIFISNISRRNQAIISKLKQQISERIANIQKINNNKFIKLKNSINTSLMKMSKSSSLYLERKKQNISNLLSKIEILNPMNLLQKGYFKIMKFPNYMVSKIKELKVGEDVLIYSGDGNAQAKIISITPKEENNGK